MLCLLILLLFNIGVFGLHCLKSHKTGDSSSVSKIIVIGLHQRLTLNCSSENVTARKSEKTSNESSVVFTSNVQWNDYGIYHCSVEGEHSCDILVKVKAAPFVELREPEELQKSMIITCYVKGAFKPQTVVWYKNNQLILPNTTKLSEKTVEPNDFVVVSKLSKVYPNVGDIGNYSCEARNKYGISRRNRYVSRNMIQEFSHSKCPEFKNKSMHVNLSVTLGSSTTVSCEVMYSYHRRGNPFFKMFKLENNSSSEITNGIGKNIYKESDVGLNWVRNYTIVNAQSNDSGVYLCDYIPHSGSICPGTLKKRFNVKVIGPHAEETSKKHNLLIVITVSIGGALAGLALVLYVCHLRKKTQIYDNCPDYLPELRWDVFVSYSSHDFSWVDNLCKMLEAPPFNLVVCLHQRDWELGRSIVDNMVDSIYCSFKTLIIVSNHYVQSQYCMQELQIAMHSEIASEMLQKERIILIKIDNVSMNRLPRVLRQRSYLDCSDSEHVTHFKTNLLRALPARDSVGDLSNDLEQQSSSDGSLGVIHLQELQVA